MQAVGIDGRALIGVPRVNQNLQTYTWEPGGDAVPPQVVEAAVGAGLSQTVAIGNGSTVSVGSVGGASALVVESGGKQVAAYGIPGLEGVTAALSSTRFVGLVAVARRPFSPISLPQRSRRTDLYFADATVNRVGEIHRP